ncbi:serine/threonine protein kinase [bacterium]|nr:serine/threonine protein kinase [bacterium]
MLDNFLDILPEVIFDAVETLGGRCTGRFLALNAMENRVYDVQMEEGPNRVIKFYRPGRWDRATLQTEHDFLKSLAANEIPVVQAMENEKGESLFQTKGVWFTVFPKKAGRLEPELNPEQLERLGRFLARLHNVGATFKNAPRFKLDPTTYGRNTLKTLQDLGSLPATVAPRYSQLVNQICDRIDPWFEKAEYILTHGDCHNGNILWQTNEPYFLDFDDMCYAPPVQDLWMVTGGDDEDGRERKAVVLEAYEQIRGFNPDSFKLIEPLRSLRMMCFNSWIAQRWADGAFKAAFPGFGTERYWQEQIESLSVQWEKIAYRDGQQP